MKLHTRQLTCAAIVGAAYAVLSIFGSIFGITYGPIQCRFSEALCVLPFLLPETAWGLGVGCLIANLLSPYGVLDIVVGSAATLLAALLTARCKKKWLAPLPPVLANMVLVGLVLAYEQAGTTAAFWPTYAFNALTVGAGEIVACYGLGMLLLPHLMPVWAFVGGCAQGASLVVALALIALRGRDSAETVVLSGVAQSFGYLIASLGPLMFGVLVQATGGHHVPLMVFTFVAFLQCVVAVIVGRPSKM